MQNIRRATYFLNVIFLVALLFSLLWKPAPPQHFAAIRAEQIPSQIASFTKSKDNAIDAVQRSVLASASIISRSYQKADKSAEPLDFTLISGTDREALHDPRACFVGAGWRIEGDHTELLPQAQLPIHVCTLRNDLTKEAYRVFYVYIVDGQPVTEVTQIRSELLFSALIGRTSRPVHFLRVVQKMDESDSPTENQTLKQFFGGMWESIAPLLTKPGKRL